jgi:hypothetical protein
VTDPLVFYTQFIGDAIFNCPTYFFAEAFSQKAYKGRFSIPPGFHAQDLQYYAAE